LRRWLLCFCKIVGRAVGDDNRGQLVSVNRRRRRRVVVRCGVGRQLGRLVIFCASKWGTAESWSAGLAGQLSKARPARLSRPAVGAAERGRPAGCGLAGAAAVEAGRLGGSGLAQELGRKAFSFFWLF
jgi:hypothetical protein